MDIGAWVEWDSTLCFLWGSQSRKKERDGFVIAILCNFCRVREAVEKGSIWVSGDVTRMCAYRVS